MKNFLLIICKNGVLQTRTITDYSKNNLEDLFFRNDIKDASYLVYDTKANKYDEGLIDRNSLIKSIRRKKWDS